MRGCRKSRAYEHLHCLTLLWQALAERAITHCLTFPPPPTHQANEMPKAPLRFLRFMPTIVRDFERSLTRNADSNLAIVSTDFKIPLRLLEDFQQIPSRSGDIRFTNRVLSDLKRLIRQSTCRQAMILHKYLERKAISHINRKTRHVQRSMVLASMTKQEYR